MAKNRNYTVKFRRKRKKLTNYVLRRKLLLSGATRFVVRRSLSGVLVQLVAYKPAGDVVVASATVAEVAKSFGWVGHQGNLPSAYLAGYLLGKKAKKAGVAQAVADLGLQKAKKGSCLFAAVKGACDAGLAVACSDSAFPAEERYTGASIAGWAKELAGSDKDKYHRQFSAYLKKGVAVDRLPELFAATKEKIDTKWP